MRYSRFYNIIRQQKKRQTPLFLLLNALLGVAERIDILHSDFLSFS